MSIGSRTEYDQYKAIKNANFRNYAFDQFQLVEVLKTLPNGKKLPLKKLFEGLHAAQEAFKFGTDEQQHKVLPPWYTRQLKEEASLIDFISKTPEVRNIGIYDAEGEYFEVFKVSHEKVYIDASNVAFNSNHRDKGAKPQLSNIKLIADELIARQFRDISVIADASLRHQVADSNMMEALKQMTNYLEAPSRSTADEFLLQFARKEKCMIISNDTFKDWKVKDSWVAENVDKLRVTFIINDGTVMFSGLDKFANR
jgi:Zc3h12a-like ribonuclease protein